MCRARYFLLPSDLLQGFAIGQFIDQLVQVTDLLHQRVCDLLHPAAADHPRDLYAPGIHPGCLTEESFKVDAFVDLLLEGLFGVSG